MLKRFQGFRKTSANHPVAAGATIGPLQYLPGETNEYFRDFVSTRTFRNPRVELFKRGSQVLTMGSCFANEVRAYLESRQIGHVLPKIPSASLALFDEASKEDSSWGAWNGVSNLQYYNTFSIRQEIEKAAGIWTQDEDDHWEVAIGNEKLYQCPYRRRIFARSPADLRDLTIAIDQEITQSLEAADLIIFTLGLTEVWRKKDNGFVSCCEPGYCHGGGETETEFLASSFQQNHDNLKVIVDEITEHFGHKNILISVSPVPLGRTFRPLDICVANMESKSILRSVAGDIASSYNNVHYFPSYEMCLSDPATFREDGRHVTREKVDQIMSLFEACHVF
jgi:hypothetical protein